MTFPPPPPDRMHLQHQSAPPPPVPQQMQQQPQMAGPGGAYGPMNNMSGQPVPGQMPSAAMTMAKPGTVTGIQVILWIFLAISAVGDVFSAISMVNFFHPLSLVGLGFAVYSTIQSIASGVHINRGKRWAWIWSLVSAILGLALASVGIVFGIWFFDNGGWVTFTVASVLAVLYGTLLGLLVSKSARQWIMMHRIQRGEVQMAGMPGMAGGMAPQGGMAPMGGMAQGGAPEPERPATRPGVATFAVLIVWLFAALTAWAAWKNFDTVRMVAEAHQETLIDTFTNIDFLWAKVGIPMFLYALLTIGAIFTAMGLAKGRAGARVFAAVWSLVALALAGYQFFRAWVDYGHFRAVYGTMMEGADPLAEDLKETNTVYLIVLGTDVGLMVVSILIFVLMLVPGVKAWAPKKPASPLIMMVPMGQQPGPQQQMQQPMQQAPGGYGPPQQQQHQQPPYPPQYLPARPASTPKASHVV